MKSNQTEPGRTATPRADLRDPELAERERANRDERVEPSERSGPEAEPLESMTRGRAARTAAQPGGDATMSWQDIKGRFVDDPQAALAAAEHLVERALEERIRALHDEAAQLHVRDGNDDPTSTEALRTRLLRYQEYCERMSSGSIH